MFPRWVWDYIRSVGGEVATEVRGWRFDVVGPRLLARPSVSDVSSPCPTKRDVWLRRVLKVRVEGGALALGRAIHEAFLYPFRYRDRDVAWVLRGFERALQRLEPHLKAHGPLLRRVFMKALALALYSLEDGVPVAVEPAIPGAAIGLSDFVRPDLLIGFVPVDISLAPGGDRVERKELALAGYALTVEAWVGHPVDFAVALYVNAFGGEGPLLTWRVVRVDDSLRRSFLEARDRVAMVIEHGEEPPLPERCVPGCPYSALCGGGH